MLKYKLDVYTGDLPESNTSAAVHVMLVGERGDTGHRKLLKSLTSNSSEEMFQQGQVRASHPYVFHRHRLNFYDLVLVAMFFPPICSGFIVRLL